MNEPSAERNYGLTAQVQCTFWHVVLVVLFLVGPACQKRAPRPPEPDFSLYPTAGGAGGQVVRVTTLAASGPGSLAAALRVSGPRIVVFEVGGVIDMAQQTLVIAEPFVTVAGQTAPSPGITIIRGSIMVTTHDVILQHIRVRPGDAGMPRRSGWEPDGISTASAYNVVIDHCSITWAVDENLSASGPRHEGRAGTSQNITFSHCIIAEALDQASHQKGAHSKGSLIHDHCTNIAVVANLYAHNDDRNPYFKADATGVIANNLIYNPGRRAITVNYVRQEYQGQPDAPQHARVSVVGNVLMHGPDTRRRLRLVTGRGDVYLEDNIAQNTAGQSLKLTTWGIRVLEEKPIWIEGFALLTAEQVFDYVLQNAGARPRDRDAVDARIIQSVREKRGHIIDSQAEVGGYPNPRPTERSLHLPEGDVDAWLKDFSERVELK